ncbi:hypothetical protein WJX72_000560 [[Myrmecia] bisecta]|uniref:Ubiquitin thioesterase OTU n=1 Tax=[Myrmecia] bisecta TaxID=41462 RepID=A0AAW1NYR5_9CHLO
MNLRCRGPSGQYTLAGLEGSLSVRAFQQMLAEKTGVPAAAQEILAGFPPKPLQLPADSAGATLADLPLQNGDTVVVRQAAGSSAAPAQQAQHSSAAAYAGQAQTMASAASGDQAESLARSLAASLAGSRPAAPAAQQAQQAQAPSWSIPPADQDDDEELARAIAASLASSDASPAPTRPQHPQPAAPAGHAGQQQIGAPTSVSLPDGTAVVRRIIASDNSCLFNAVGYVMERSKTRAPHLRRVIAETVAADPETYSEAFLEKPNAEYRKWIQDPLKWGGAIELSILASYFGREIAAYDIQTKRCDVYGQGNDYIERVMLLYDGLHYDAMALAAFEGAPEEIDVTIFDPTSPSAPAIERAAAELVAKAHEARQFTDTTNFTLRCGVCQIGVKGEKEAREHAKATGHQSFSEYHRR